MVRIEPVQLDKEHYATAIEVNLPETFLSIVTVEKGYIMCGALDISVLNRKYPDRQIAAGRALGVKTVRELLDAPLESVTIKAKELGVREGMIGKEALLKMS